MCSGYVGCAVDMLCVCVVDMLGVQWICCVCSGYVLCIVNMLVV